tara:strand:- start:652 stop:1458 length:807 start_codon:yes stop_codon:yes gene_type:complete
MKVPRDLLLQLLAVTKREQSINGKAQPQVTGCILSLGDKRLSTTGVVKDGKTSLSRFSFTCDDDTESMVPVPDIDRLIGVLKYHGDIVKLTYNKETSKVLVKSNNKQTTLVGGLAAKAFSNSQQSLVEWHKSSVERALQIKGNVYHMADGKTRSPFATIKLSSDVLHDALKCDAVNGQKLNRYTFNLTNGDLLVTVGDHFKGLTETTVDTGYSNDDFTAIFEGGLENIVRYYKGDVSLAFLDFTSEGQGTRLIMSFDNGDWVFQAGVL